MSSQPKTIVQMSEELKKYLKEHPESGIEFDSLRGDRKGKFILMKFKFNNLALGFKIVLESKERKESDNPAYVITQIEGDVLQAKSEFENKSFKTLDELLKGLEELKKQVAETKIQAKTEEKKEEIKQTQPQEQQQARQQSSSETKTNVTSNIVMTKEQKETVERIKAYSNFVDYNEKVETRGDAVKLVEYLNSTLVSENIKIAERIGSSKPVFLLYVKDSTIIGLPKNSVEYGPAGSSTYFLHSIVDEQGKIKLSTVYKPKGISSIIEGDRGRFDKTVDSINEAIAYRLLLDSIQRDSFFILENFLNRPGIENLLEKPAVINLCINSLKEFYPAMYKEGKLISEFKAPETYDDEQKAEIQRAFGMAKKLESAKNNIKKEIESEVNQLKTVKDCDKAIAFIKKGYPQLFTTSGAPNLQKIEGLDDKTQNMHDILIAIEGRNNKLNKIEQMRAHGLSEEEIKGAAETKDTKEPKQQVQQGVGQQPAPEIKPIVHGLTVTTQPQPQQKTATSTSQTQAIEGLDAEVKRVMEGGQPDQKAAAEVKREVKQSETKTMTEGPKETKEEPHRVLLRQLENLTKNEALGLEFGESLHSRREWAATINFLNGNIRVRVKVLPGKTNYNIEDIWGYTTQWGMPQVKGEGPFLLKSLNPQIEQMKSRSFNTIEELSTALQELKPAIDRLVDFNTATKEGDWNKLKNRLHTEEDCKTAFDFMREKYPQFFTAEGKGAPIIKPDAFPNLDAKGKKLHEMIIGIEKIAQGLERNKVEGQMQGVVLALQQAGKSAQRETKTEQKPAADLRSTETTQTTGATVDVLKVNAKKIISETSIGINKVLEDISKAFKDNNEKIKTALSKSQVSDAQKESTQKTLTTLINYFEAQKKIIVARISALIEQTGSKLDVNQSSNELVDITVAINNITKLCRSKYDTIYQELSSDVDMLINLPKINREFLKALEPLQKNYIALAQKATQDLSKLQQPQQQPTQETKPNVPGPTITPQLQGSVASRRAALEKAEAEAKAQKDKDTTRKPPGKT